jgi:hypothetical protein
MAGSRKINYWDSFWFVRRMKPASRTTQILQSDVVRVVTSPLWVAIWAFATTTYFLVLDVYGADLGWNHLSGLPWRLFITAIALNAVFLGLNLWRNYTITRHTEMHQSVLAEIGRFSESLNSTRKQRMIDVINSLLPACLCNEVTDPAARITEVLGEIRTALLHQFHMDPKYFDIHVMGKHPDSGNWTYLFSPIKDRTRTPAEVIMSNPSAARQAINDKTDVFYPDKRVARTGASQYFHSHTDQQHEGKGSIFVHPITFELSTGQHHTFVISVKSYGSQFCGANDEIAVARAKGIISRFVEFVEPELFLYISCCKFRQREAVATLEARGSN